MTPDKFRKTIVGQDGRTYCLRLLAENDCDLLYDFFCGLSDNIKRVFHPYQFTRATASALVNDIESRRRLVLLATTDQGTGETIAGYAFIHITPIFKNQGVFGIAVREEFQGQGIASQLLAHLLFLAQRAGCRRVWLRVFETNQPARALYQKMGFMESAWPRSIDLMALRVRDGLVIYGLMLPMQYVRSLRRSTSEMMREISMVIELDGQ
jgi:ribosomal protein S18 acetylase RimI-like enzyme